MLRYTILLSAAACRHHKSLVNTTWGRHAGAAHPNILDEDAMTEHVVVQIWIEWQPHLHSYINGWSHCMLLATHSSCAAAQGIAGQAHHVPPCKQIGRQRLFLVDLVPREGKCTFSVRRPPGAVSFVVTHSERVSLVYFTCKPPQSTLTANQNEHRCHMFQQCAGLEGCTCGRQGACAPCRSAAAAPGAKTACMSSPSACPAATLCRPVPAPPRVACKRCCAAVTQNMHVLDRISVHAAAAIAACEPPASAGPPLMGCCWGPPPAAQKGRPCFPSWARLWIEDQSERQQYCNDPLPRVATEQQCNGVKQLCKGCSVCCSERPSHADTHLAASWWLG